MSFTKPLPGWQSAGVEPDENKKVAGWEENEHPPAAIFDWFFYVVGEALKEIHEKGIDIDTVATLTTKGITQLSSSTSSTSESVAATAKAVKLAYDLANGKYTKPTTGIPKSDLSDTVQKSLTNADNSLSPDAKGKASGIASLDTKKRVQQELAPYSLYKTNKDANGIYTTVEFKRLDGTLSKRSILSTPDANGNYQTQNILYFDTDGTTLLINEIYAITYDADGAVLNEVKQ